MRVKLAFVVRALTLGGAQRQLVELVKGLDPQRFDVVVFTFYADGELAPELAALDRVKIISLDKRGRWDILPFLWRFWRRVKHHRPDVLHGYMGVANELCLAIGRPCGAKVVWGLRASELDLSQNDWAVRWSFRIGVWLSKKADLIIANSQAGKRFYLAQGYPGHKLVVVPNGINTTTFRPEAEGGKGLRKRWGIAEGAPLIGMVARLDPVKNHAAFLRAAARLLESFPKARYVCVGDGTPAYRQRLQRLAESLGLGSRLVWAGVHHDLAAVYSALDISTLSSSSEGFSNAIGESMACAVPCVVTDVGDAAWIVGETGVVVPPGDPEALAEGWLRLINLPLSARNSLGNAARSRVVAHFSTEKLIDQTTSLLVGLLKGQLS